MAADTLAVIDDKTKVHIILNENATKKLWIFRYVLSSGRAVL
jgi:hypothetical protein